MVLGSISLQHSLRQFRREARYGDERSPSSACADNSLAPSLKQTRTMPSRCLYLRASFALPRSLIMLIAEQSRAGIHQIVGKMQFNKRETTLTSSWGIPTQASSRWCENLVYNCLRWIHFSPSGRETSQNALRQVHIQREIPRHYSGSTRTQCAQSNEHLNAHVRMCAQQKKSMSTSKTAHAESLLWPSARHRRRKKAKSARCSCQRFSHE